MSNKSQSPRGGLPPVKPERSQWRDLGLSKRHRLWGWDCPVVDMDFIMLEYDKAQPIAIIEYKHENAKPASAKNANYRAITELANRADIMFFAVRYASNFLWFKTIPINTNARTFQNERKIYTELDYVAFLYRLRNRTIPLTVKHTIEDTQS